MSEPHPHPSRFVSRITSETLVLILAGGKGNRLHGLTEWRAKPAVPFGGRFRIIDFALSNCMNSHIRRICVLTQYKSHSLIRHINRAWGSLRGEMGEFVEVIPAQQWMDSEEWFAGTADAVWQSLDIILSHNPKHILILSGDHVYKMDYGSLVAAHVVKEADMTVACTVVPRREARGFGVMAVDGSDRIVAFEEKPDDPRPLPDDPDHALASMGIYVFSIDFLVRQLHRDAYQKGSDRDFGRDIIPHAVEQDHRLFAYPFVTPVGGDATPYWQDVGTLDAFFNTHMELLAPNPPINLFDSAWPVYSPQEHLPPARFTSMEDRHGVVEDSMVSGGCLVSGSRIRRSILSPGVEIRPGSTLEETVVLPHCTIGRDCRLRRVILDKGCVIPAGTVIGEDPVADGERFHRTDAGVVLVTRKDLWQDYPYPSY